MALVIAARILAPELPLAEAAQIAASTHLHLVITRQGAVVLTPVLLPGMVRIAVSVDAREAA